MMTKTILITGARAPVALHLARLLHFAGHRVHLACSLPSPMAESSKACTEFHLIPPPRFAFDAFAAALKDIVATHGVDLIIPTCEEVFYVAQLKPQLTVDIWCPNLDELAQVHNKFTFIEQAKSLGLTTPETTLLSSQDELNAVADGADRLVFKPCWSRFATQVLIQPSQTQLRRVHPTQDAPWIAQAFVSGTEISAYAMAQGGKLLGLAQYHSLYRAGQGAGICFAPMDDPDVTDFVTEFIAMTAWTGQISFDVIKTADGTVYPLECNPRATSGLHFFTDPIAFAHVILSQSGAVRPDVTGPLAVKLAMWVYGAPKALISGKWGAFLTMLRSSQDPLAWDNDPRPIKRQRAALGAIAKVAMRDRVGLQSASTRDIEWNGPNQS